MATDAQVAYGREQRSRRARPWRSTLPALPYRPPEHQVVRLPDRGPRRLPLRAIAAAGWGAALVLLIALVIERMPHA